MKAGVRTTPCAVCRAPARADPSRALTSNLSRFGSVLTDPNPKAREDHAQLIGGLEAA
jgi:hypothetical protein